jgi:hypothetical protein
MANLINSHALIILHRPVDKTAKEIVDNIAKASACQAARGAFPMVKSKTPFAVIFLPRVFFLLS